MALKAGRAALLVEVGDKLHQVHLTEDQTRQLLNYVAALQGGEIRADEHPIESIYLNRK